MAGSGKGGGRGPKKSKGKASSRKAAPRKAAGKKRTPNSRTATASAAMRRQPQSAVRRKRTRRDLIRRLVFGGLVLAVAGFLVYSAAGRNSERRNTIERLESGPGSCRYDTEFDGTASQQSVHIPSPTYRVDPPAGGAHEPTPAPPGFFETGDVPPDGKLVHAMEHGFIVLWYRPDLSADGRTTLEELSDRFGRELIVAPRASLRGEMALTAWHRRLLCERLDPEAVALFTTSYKDQGREKGFL